MYLPFQPEPPSLPLQLTKLLSLYLCRYLNLRRKSTALNKFRA